MQCAQRLPSHVLPSSEAIDRASAAPPDPARALSEKERDKVFETLCSERFVDRSPAEVVATLLDEDVYLCSERTIRSASSGTSAESVIVLFMTPSLPMALCRQVLGGCCMIHPGD